MSQQQSPTLTQFSASPVHVCVCVCVCVCRSILCNDAVKCYNITSKVYSAMLEQQGQGNTEVLREKTNPVPPCPSQISHNFTWYQI